MTAIALALLDAVHANGGTVTLDGDNLRLSAPTPLPEFLRASLRQHKPLLVALLAAQTANSNHPPEPTAEPTKPPQPALIASQGQTNPAPLSPVEPGPWSAGIPDQVARGIGAIFTAPFANGIPERHWPTVVADTLAFVENGQAAQAFTLGWTAGDLFGCDQRAPWNRLDRAGLMLLVGGRAIPEITSVHAALRHRDGSVLRFRRLTQPPHPPVAMLWHLLPSHLRPHVGPAP
ncbi:hypothetical protein WCLP8_2140001 [uncultured Gammaproteobacteria bacterium]